MRTLRSTRLAAVAAFILAAATPPRAQTPVDRAIERKLADAPISLDKEHPGPKMFPDDLPAGTSPFDCRSVQAYEHALRPGAYHFQRAQRLLGLGIDVIGCEAFGLDRWSGDVDRAERAVLEAEAAAAAPIGVEQWVPGALQHVLLTAYDRAAEATRDTEKARGFRQKRTEVKNGILPRPARGEHLPPLRLAVVRGEAARVRTLLAAGALADVPDENGVTALMDACAMGLSDIAVTLLDAGASLHARADDGLTPFLSAATSRPLPSPRDYERRRAFIAALLSRGADVNARDWAGRTALMDAAALDAELVAMLLSAGAAVDAQDVKGRTALIEAIDRDLVGAVEQLLKARATVSLSSGEALASAARKGYQAGERMTRMLLEAGADPNQAGPGLGWTPLMWAVDFIVQPTEPWGASASANVRALLDRGARLEARRGDGATPLIVEASKLSGPDDPILLTQLIQAGANVNASDREGTTALMAAAERGSLNKVVTLLRAGALAAVKDARGRTALDYARDERGDSDNGPYCSSWDSYADKQNDCAAIRVVLKRAMPARID
jgi:ankyrin repeat protein